MYMLGLYENIWFFLVLSIKKIRELYFTLYNNGGYVMMSFLVSNGGYENLYSYLHQQKCMLLYNNLVVFLSFLMLYVNFWWSTILNDTFWCLKYLNLLVNKSTKAHRHTKSIQKHKKTYNSTHKHSKKKKITYSPRDVDVNISWAVFFSFFSSFFFFFFFGLVMLVTWQS